MHTVIHNWYLKGWREKKGKGETQGLVASQGYCCEGYTQTPGRKVLQQKGIRSCKCGSLFLLMSHWETGLSGAKKISGIKICFTSLAIGWQYLL